MPVPCGCGVGRAGIAQEDQQQDSGNTFPDFAGATVAQAVWV